MENASAATNKQTPWPGVGEEGAHSPILRDQRQAAAGRAGRLLQHAPSALSPTEQLFQDYLLLRDQAFEQRDAVYRRLNESYFASHPEDRATAKHVSEEEIDSTIRAWISQGCPIPAATLAGDQPSQTDQQEEAPWPLALELEQLQTAAQERSRILERLCEAQPSGHQIEATRDASGIPRTICSRCGASLSSRAPDAREEWLLR
jgi:hypothetical protein